MDKLYKKYEDEITLHKIVFTEIYEKHKLGNDNSIYYDGSSGEGSTYEYNEKDFIPFLTKFITNNQIKTIVDLGCGNLGYNRTIYDKLGIDAYYGYDIYKKLQNYNRTFFNDKKYKFYTMDFLKHYDEIQSSDLCIIKDVLQHWMLKDIYYLLDKLIENNKFKYIMIINCCDQKHDYNDSNDISFKTGEWRKLSANFLPLSKYNPRIIFKYKTKEVSLITCSSYSNKII